MKLFQNRSPAEKPHVEQQLFTEEEEPINNTTVIHKTPGQNKDMRLTRESGTGRLGLEQGIQPAR